MSHICLFLLLIYCLSVVVCGQKTEEERKAEDFLTDELEPAIQTAEAIVDKHPKIAGIRVEPIETNSEGFVGYNQDGASVVRPEIDVKIVIFGSWLSLITDVAFTSSDNCSDAIIKYDNYAFQTQLEYRLVVKTKFPKGKDVYKLCVGQKAKEKEPAESEVNTPTVSVHYSILDDPKSSVSTELPPRKYYLPMAIQISIILFLLVLSGLFSGLNLGLMALNPQELELISKSGSKQERKYAETILPVRRSGNFLLCSLLIGNVLVNSAISILFDDLTSGYVALIVSSIGIVVFGEIFPQSICVKKGLAVGSHTIWITRFFMVLTCPLSYPIGKILDCILGDEVTVYDRKRLMEMMKMTTHLAEELKIAVGAMEISDKTVKDVMTRIDDVFMLTDTTTLSTKTVAEILRMGYTRIPVFTDGDRNNVVSLLFVKDLALLDPDDNFTIKTVCGYSEHPLRFIMEDTPLRVMLEEFKKGDYHLAMVQRIIQPEEGDPMYELVGIVTLEDIVEEILQAEIVDETDVVTDNVNRTRRRDVQARDLTRMLETEQKMTISVQLQLVTMQWLTSNQDAFHETRISNNVLDKLVRQHVRQVEMAHLADSESAAKMGVPRIARLYTKLEPSERFVLILEGRVLVTIGQNEMQSEAGPWHCFGEEMLKKVVELAPTFTTQQNPALSYSRQSLSGDMESRKRHIASFIPDYSAVVKDSCTYLDISIQSYISAYRATLMQKGVRPSVVADFVPSIPPRGGLSAEDSRVITEIRSNRANSGENSAFSRDPNGFRATIGSPTEAERLLYNLSSLRRSSEENSLRNMSDIASHLASRKAAQIKKFSLAATETSLNQSSKIETESRSMEELFETEKKKDSVVVQSKNGQKFDDV